MLITAIEPRRRSLCEVYIDGESAGLLDLETLERLHVKMGQELTDSQVEQLLSLVRSMQGLDADELQKRLESLQNTYNTANNVGNFFSDLGKKVSDFFKSVGDFFSNIFGGK